MKKEPILTRPIWISSMQAPTLPVTLYLTETSALTVTLPAPLRLNQKWLGQTGNVEGDINAQNADISGIVKGNIYVGKLLTLKASCKVYGDVVTKKIIIESGAEFNGRCHMKSDKNEAIASTKDARATNGQPGKPAEKINVLQ